MNATADVWLRKAIRIAAYSKDLDLRDRVGCVIAVGDELAATGWNHTLDDAGMRDMVGKAQPFVVHAETAAIQEALATLYDTHNCLEGLGLMRVYCTKEPCLHCLVQLANAQVEEIHYIDAIPEAKSGRQHLKHFPSIKVYQQHVHQLPDLLRALGLPNGGRS